MTSISPTVKTDRKFSNAFGLDCAPSYALWIGIFQEVYDLIIDEPWDSLTGWTTYYAVEISPAGKLHFGPLDGCSFATVSKLLADLPDEYTTEVCHIFDFFGAPSQISRLDIRCTNGYVMQIRIYKDKIRYETELGFSEIAITNAEDTWYVWTVVVDTSPVNVKVFRDNDLVLQYYSMPSTSSDGSIWQWFWRTSGSRDAESHEDYWRIASGLHEPFGS